MRVVITDADKVTAVWEAAGQTGPVPSSLTVQTAKQGTTQACACGCGGRTAGTWVPGHDAKRKSLLYAHVRGTDAKQAAKAVQELTERNWPLPATKPEPAPLA